MSVDDLVGAIRAAGDQGEDPGLAAVTRLRVVRSLEARARGRHQGVGVATAIAILLGGTVSWALATGQAATLWSPPAPRVAAEVTPPPSPPQRPSRRRAPSAPPSAPPGDPVTAPAIAVDPRPALPPEAVTPPAPPPRPSPVPASRPHREIAAPPVEGVYRRAHELHFHGGDPAAALAAWDAYLAAEPDGRFAVEASYNRALVLVRLGRYAQAREALAAFARGDVVPAGYRQAEAAQLVQRLAGYP